MAPKRPLDEREGEEPLKDVPTEGDIGGGKGGKKRKDKKGKGKKGGRKKGNPKGRREKMILEKARAPKERKVD